MRVLWKFQPSLGVPHPTLADARAAFSHKWEKGTPSLRRQAPRRGEGHLYQRAFVLAALDREGGVVGLDQRLGHGQAEAGAGGLARGGDLAERLQRYVDFVVRH